MPTGGKQSTVCRVQINLTSLCHRGIGRSIGDCCSGAWGCKIISDGSSTAFIRRGRRWSANRRHCSTFLLATLNRPWLNIRCQRMQLHWERANTK